MEFPAAISQTAHQIDHVSLALLGMSTLLVVAVWFTIVLFCWRYYKGSQVDRTNPPKKARRLELVVMGIIFLVGFGIFFWSARLFYHLTLANRNAPEIFIIAKQWMWTVHDPRYGDNINRVIVPLGQPVRLIMTSEDVIHSFYIPALRIKQDVLPGRYTTLAFVPEKIGQYEILCSQYCGLDHATMRATLDVVSAEDYRNRTASVSSVHLGKDIYIKHQCAACHSGPTAPPLTHLYGQSVALQGGKHVIADENYIRRSLVDPNREIVAGYSAVMPTFQGQLSERELAALIEYLKAGTP